MRKEYRVYYTLYSGEHHYVDVWSAWDDAENVALGEMPMKHRKDLNEITEIEEL